MSLLYQGSVDEGLNALEVAFEVGFRESWLLAAPLFDPLRENGRFTALQERYRHAWQENVTGVLALICGEELPEFGWREITSIRAAISVLTFARQDRIATIQVQGATLLGSEVSITVSPQGKQHMPGAAMPGAPVQ